METIFKCISNIVFVHIQYTFVGLLNIYLIYILSGSIFVINIFNAYIKIYSKTHENYIQYELSDFLMFQYIIWVFWMLSMVDMNIVFEWF